MRGAARGLGHGPPQTPCGEAGTAGEARVAPDAAAVLAAVWLLRRPLPQRFDECGYVTPVLGCQLADAGDEELGLLVARVFGAAGASS